MNKNGNSTNNEKRLLSLPEASEYIGLGKRFGQDWLRSIGAERKIGRRVLFDRVVIDRHLDGMNGGEPNGHHQ